MKPETRFTSIIVLLALVIPLASSCGGSSDESPAQGTPIPSIAMSISHEELKARIDKYAGVAISYDQSIVSEPEKRALAKLVEAGYIMDEIFLRQVWSGNTAMRDDLHMAVLDSHENPRSEAAIHRDLVEDIDHFFRINFGPWDRLDEDSPFIGTIPKPAGANYYPEDLSTEDFEAHIAANPGDEEAFRGFFTTIRRQDDGLVAVPYSTEYKDQLQRAAALLHETADILTKSENVGKYAAGVDYTTLATFLRSRADAFSSNDYFQSDMDWMDVRDNIIDVTIGPYETYEDGLNGYKAAFETFIAIRNPTDSKKLEGIKGYLQLLENSLPIPDEHKNPNRGSESPISVVDLVFAGGDTKAGVQTIAFNLPNDERVREAKGSKKVMLKNISQAKFDKILVPIAREILDPAQLDHVDFDAYFNNVLMHEMAHGLGPGTIKRADGTETTVSRELKELYATLEEAKADISGLYCRKILVDEGFFEKGSDVKGYVSFLPGFFRAIRFGATSAHGKANMIEFNFMREQGAITLDADTDRFHVNLDKMPAAVEALSNRLLMIQAVGDYDAAAEFIAKYGEPTPDVDRMLEKLANIPVDIEPQYAAEEIVKHIGL
ncbi:MAG: peptidase [Candidatus Krumholzibacteria bacterium]|nr:peptidase [Candidatus Krumholzibacteria bacterium]